MGQYPIMLNTSNLLAVVVGGGQVGRRRVAGLLAAGVKVRIIDPAGGDWPAGVEVYTEHYRPDRLAGAHLVFACTDNPGVNVCIAADARAAGALVNRADDPADSDFACPAVWRGESVLLAVTAGAPALAAAIRDALAEALPAGADAFASAVAELRERVKADVPEAQRRAAILRRLAGQEGLAAFRADGQEGLAAWLRAALAQAE